MGDTHRRTLAYRPPYNWDALISFLSARATPGVELVEPHRYRRTIGGGGRSGTIEVRRAPAGSALTLEVRIAGARDLPAIVERVRHMFDVEADPEVIAGHLGADPMLGPRLRAHPGIRTPGAWDPFELAVRAVLGQQVSVRAATTIAGRIAEVFGSPIEDEDGLSRLFPTAAQLLDAPVERTGVMPARASAIRALARAVVEGRVSLQSGTDGHVAPESLMDLPGIGPWTASYIAMRAYGEPDAFPSGDLVLRQAAGGCTARELEAMSQAWRPWRSYAVMLLWQAPRIESIESRRTHALRDRDDSRGGGHRGSGRGGTARRATGARG
jgi:AraC family transcriptional regulator, regulatory protein of adaptative response / DNA-3-methyladenine glycosylase II